jgi:hypothetical protein
MANQEIIEMFFIVQANSFDRNKWSSKVFNDDKIEGTMTFLVSINGGKS